MIYSEKNVVVRIKKEEKTNEKVNREKGRKKEKHSVLRQNPYLQGRFTYRDSAIIGLPSGVLAVGLCRVLAANHIDDVVAAFPVPPFDAFSGCENAFFATSGGGLYIIETLHM